MPLIVMGLVTATFADGVAPAPTPSLKLDCGYLTAGDTEQLTLPVQLQPSVPVGQRALLIVEERGNDVILVREKSGASQPHDLAPSGWAYQPVELLGANESWRIEAATAGDRSARLRLQLICFDGAAAIPQQDALRAMQMASTHLANSVSAGRSSEQRAADTDQGLRLFEGIAAAAGGARSSQWPWLAAMALQSAAFLHGRNGEPELSIKKFAQAIALWRRNDDSFRALLGTHRMAQQARRQGRLQQAESWLQEVVDGLPTSHPSSLRGMAMTDLCLTLRGQLKLAEAKSCYERAIDWHRQRGDKAEQAMTLANRASVHRLLGHFEDVRTDATLALTIAREVKARRAEWAALVELGGADRAGAKTESAVRHYLAAAPIGEALNDRNLLANARWQLAQTWYLAGDLNRAGDFAATAVEAYRTGGYWARAAEALLLRSSISRSQGNFAEAIASANEARRLLQQQGMTEGMVEAGLALAESHAERGQWEECASALGALPQRIEKLPFNLRLRHRLLNARLSIARENPQQALRQALEVEREAERSGDPLFGAEAMGLAAQAMNALGQLAAAEQKYADTVTSLLRLAQAQSYPVYRALYAARAERAFGEYLNVSRRRSFSAASVNARLSLFNRLRSATTVIALPRPATANTGLDAAQANLNEALRRRWLDTGETESAASAVQLATLFAEVESRFSATVPAPEQKPMALSLPLPSDTAVLALSIGKEEVFAWLLTDGQVVENVSASAPRVRETAQTLSAMLRDPRSDVLQIQILVDELRAALKIDRALIERIVQWRVVADSALADVPLSLLLASTQRSASISQLASLSAAGARSRSAGSASCCAGMAISAFADPAATGGLRTASASSSALRGSGLSRLPGSRREIREIERVWSGGAVESRLGAQFTAAAVLAALRAPHRIVHIATHGLKHAQTVGLNALLVVDEADPAVLRVLGWNEILLNPIAADLVVLGACDVGGGAVIDGGNSVGLAQAFLSAGAPSVVAPLWRVDDEASIGLMRAFYTAMANGAPPARALAAAQADMRLDERYRHPFFWSGMSVFE